MIWRVIILVGNMVLDWLIGRRGGLVALASNQNKGALTRRPSITVRSSRGILGNI